MGRTTLTCRHPESGVGNCVLCGRQNRCSDTWLSVVHHTLSSAFLRLSVVNFVGGPNRPSVSSEPAVVWLSRRSNVLRVGLTFDGASHASFRRRAAAFGAGVR